MKRILNKDELNDLLKLISDENIEEIANKYMYDDKLREKVLYAMKEMPEDALGLMFNEIGVEEKEYEYIIEKVRKNQMEPFILDIIDKEQCIRKCIEDKSLDLSQEDVVRLIARTENEEYIKECIKNENLGLSQYDIVDLILKTKNKEYIKKCVQDDSLGLSQESIMNLILKVGLKDKSFLKECVENDKLKLDKYYRIILIKKTNDKKYIKKCIKNEKLNLSNRHIIDLIKSIEDKEDIKECIQDDSLNLKEKTKKMLAIKTGEFEVINKFMNNRVTDEKKILLPVDMTIGIEIESEGDAKSIQFLPEKIENWKIVDDRSLQQGKEIISPILHVNEKSIREIYDICEILKELNHQASKTCGGHVHIGANYLKSKQSYSNLINIITNTEKILYLISNDKSTAPRENIQLYALPISNKIENAIKYGKINLETEEDLNDFIEQLQMVQTIRETGVNFLNINNTRNTVEFRLANGTINPDIWIENINLFGGIVEASEKIAQIQSKSNKDMTDEEIKIIETFEMLSKEGISEEQKLECLLELTVLDKDVYIERYKENIKEIDKNPEIIQLLKKNELNRPITPKVIGKKCFMGENNVTGQELKEVNEQINRDMKEEKYK